MTPRINIGTNLKTVKQTSRLADKFQGNDIQSNASIILIKHKIQINILNIYQQLIHFTSLPLPFIIITFRDTISFPNSFLLLIESTKPFSVHPHIIQFHFNDIFNDIIYYTSYYHAWYSTPYLLFTPYQNDQHPYMQQQYHCFKERVVPENVESANSANSLCFAKSYDYHRHCRSRCGHIRPNLSPHGMQTPLDATSGSLIIGFCYSSHTTSLLVKRDRRGVTLCSYKVILQTARSNR